MESQTWSRENAIPKASPGNKTGQGLADAELYNKADFSSVPGAGKWQFKIAMLLWTEIREGVASGGVGA